MRFHPVANRTVRVLVVPVLFIAAVFLATAWPAISQVAPSTASISFGYGSGVHLADPDGLDRVPVWIDEVGTPVDYTLYALPIEEFIQRYLTDPQGSQPIVVEGKPAVTWQQSYPKAPGSDGLRYAEIPKETPPGFFIITAQQGQSHDASYLAHSEHVLVAKQAVGGQVVVWASRLQDRSPSAGMTITLYDEEAKQLGQTVTGDDGVARFEQVGARPVLTVGQLESQVTLVGFDWQWMSDGAYWYGAWDASDSGAYRVYLHTDRPIYRPGQTIYYQAFLRRRQNGLYTPIDATQPLTLTLRDARGNQVDEQQKIADDFGAVSGEFALSDSPSLGTYFVDLDIGGQIQSQQLRVEEYRKPDYGVELSITPEHAVHGDTMKVSVDAAYFFGQPVAGANVTVKVYRDVYRRYWGAWWEDSGALPGDSLLVEWNGVTDGDGRWSTQFAPEADEGWDATLTFIATVTDARNQPVENSARAYVHWNALQLQMRTGKWGYDLGEPATVELVATTHDGVPLEGQAITVHLLKDDWENNSRIDAVPPQQVMTDAEGKGQVTFTGIPQGWYRVEASTTDARGRLATVETYLWVFDRASASWWYRSDDEISIQPDKESYAPGDEAHLLIQSRATGQALLTMERDGVLYEQIVAINGPVTSVPVTITTAFAPNVYARIHLFQPGQTDGAEQGGEGRLLTAQTNIEVPAPDKQLVVTISADKLEYTPSVTATIALTVKNRTGEPLQARLGLALVDEAIFALQQDLSADLFDTFYGLQPLQVRTYDTLARGGYRWFPVEGIYDDVGAPPPMATPEKDAGGEPGANSVQPRRLFLDTAYWNPHVTTDKDGHAEVQVRLPDNLTTWRIVVRGITLNTEVGYADAQLLVTQEIIARPTLPRFAVLGDRFQTGLVAQNFSGEATSGKASLKASHLVLLDAGDRSVAMPDGGTTVANWTAVAARPESGFVTTTLTTSRGADVVELPLPVKPFAAPDRVAAAGQANLVAEESFIVPHNAVNTASHLAVRLSPSLALGVLDGLEQLIDYPYGCVEQTMSRLLPSAVAARAYTELGMANPKAGELPAIMASGLQKIYGFQHEDGSWGWFFDDEGGAYLTAYVLFGLLSVEEAGFDVEDKVVAGGLAYLDYTLPGVDDPNVLAYAHYVRALAGRGDSAAMQGLLGQVSQLDSAALAMLALALHEEGEETAAQGALDSLIARAVETTSMAHWPTPDQEWSWRLWQTMPSVEKNTASAVRALSALRADHPLLPKAVRWLLEHRLGAGWKNTQATAFAVLGLVDVIHATGELESDYSYAVMLNDTTLITGQVTPASATDPIAPLTIEGADLLVGENILRIERSAGPGALYYSALLEQQLFFTKFTEVQSMDQGLLLTRAYELIEGTPRGDGAYTVGDLVEVRLTLDARDELAYVIVEDPIPAGFEGVLERMTPSAYGHRFFDWECWGCWGYNQKNMRDDRVEFFVTRLWPGQHTYTYLMRATTPGEFSVLPGQAYPMYNDEVWGRSASAQVQIAIEQVAPRSALAGDFDHSCLIDEFDTKLVAGAYGSEAAEFDVVADGRIDLRDVTAVGSRSGAGCGSDLPAPGEGGDGVQLSLHTSASNPKMATTFSVDVVWDVMEAAGGEESVSLQGYGLTLNFDPTVVQVQKVTLNRSLGTVLPLGPYVDNSQGRVALGAYKLASPLGDDPALATITFHARSVGATAITASAAEAADLSGRVMEAGLGDSLQIEVSGERRFFPNIGS